jgi:hypothetical protein
MRWLKTKRSSRGDEVGMAFADLAFIEISGSSLITSHIFLQELDALLRA